MKALFICLSLLITASSFADLKVKEFSGLPFVRRNFEQLYLGKGAEIQQQDLIYSNQGKLVLASDLWTLSLGVDTKVKWRSEGKVFYLTIMEGSVVLEKTSDRKAYLQLNTPTSSSTGELESFFVHVNEMSTKVWMNEGSLDFKLKSVALKAKVDTGELLEYRSGDTMIHKAEVDDEFLNQLRKDLMKEIPQLAVEHSAVDREKLLKIAEANARRKENRAYYRSQRAKLIQSIQEAVLEDGAFTFSLPISPPPQ